MGNRFATFLIAFTISGFHEHTRKIVLRSLRPLELDAIQFYIPWNYHESVPGVYDFNGERDVVEY